MVYSHKHVFIADLKNEWYTVNGIKSQTCFYSWSKEWMVYSHKHVFIADLKNEWYTVTNMFL